MSEIRAVIIFSFFLFFFFLLIGSNKVYLQLEHKNIKHNSCNNNIITIKAHKKKIISYIQISMATIAEYEEVHYNHTAKRLDAPSSYLIRKAKLENKKVHYEKRNMMRSMADALFAETKDENTDEAGVEMLTNAMTSKTIYVGNISEYTKEEQLYELFSEVGSVQTVIMGLDRLKFTPCGFAFVIFDDIESAMNAVKFTKNAILDGKRITVDLDSGFESGREFGRGFTGGQRTRADYNRMKQFVAASNRHGARSNVYIPNKNKKKSEAPETNEEQ